MTTTELKLHEPYNDIRTELATLAEQNDKVVFDYEDPKGNKLARSHIYSFRQIKSSIEKRRKELKADALEYGRKVDAAAKELTAQVVAMIEVHEEPIKRIERREEERKQAIQEAIDKIGAAAMVTDGADSQSIGEALAAVELITIDADTYQERMSEATELREGHISNLNERLEQAKKAETEAAELERLRKEKEERERKEREERIAREAAERAQREAEEKARREREEAERKAQAEREEAARRQREAEEATAKAKAEAERRERELREQAEREKREAIEAEQRRQREAEEAREREAAKAKAEQEKRAANKRHQAKVMNEVMADMRACVDTRLDTDDPVEIIADAIKQGIIAHTTIQF